MARVLGVLRLSRAKDESTSLERQRVYVQSWADANGHTVVGWAVDEDVSGSVAPWERPDLGRWLPSNVGTLSPSPSDDARAYAESRAGDFDIICAWKIDRLTRRMLHLYALVEWCRRHGKSIVATADGFDMNSPVGRVVLAMLGALAEGELEAIRERTRDSAAHLIQSGRWRGGLVPYGYRPEKEPDGKGYRLAIDPETADVIRRIVARVMDGASVNSVCAWLNSEGIPTPVDAQRIRNGQAPTGAQWRMGNLDRMLRSETLLGHAETSDLVNGRRVRKPVRAEDGLPLKRAEPILSREDFDRLQAELSSRAGKKIAKRAGGSLLLRVFRCECGDPMYVYQSGRKKAYYRCGSKARAGTGCGATGSIAVETVDAYVTEKVLALYGEAPVTRRVFVPGENHRAEIAEIERALKDLRDDRAAGLFSGERGTAEYRETYSGLERRRDALAALPDRPDEWREEPTGETLADRWASLETVQDRNAFLRSLGIGVRFLNEPMRYRTVVLPGESLEWPEGTDERLRRVTIDPGAPDDGTGATVWRAGEMTDLRAV